MRKAQSHLYLFISCELDGSFWGNFQDIHPVAPPQRLHSAFFDHILKAAHHIPFKASETVNLTVRIRQRHFV